MAQILQVGGGMCGLLSAVLLAKDGHDVTLLERDAMEPPADPEEAWERWERKGVNQFRMLHFLQPRFRAIAEVHLPEFVDALDKAGAARFNSIDEIDDAVTGRRRADDDRFTALTGRRPVIESAMGAVADSTPRLTVRRGVAVAGLLTGASANGHPHVTGVRTESGEEIRADLVIDAMGRRSALPRWLTDIGAPPVPEEEEDCGFIYYGRHFRSDDGSLPPVQGGLLTALGTISTLLLPADNGTWGIGIVTSAEDKQMRALKDVDKWTAVVRDIPAAAPWLEGEPLDERIAVMAGIPDRHRTFVVDGEPVVTGLVAVADAWACTNPSVGRGITIGLIHALALRETVAAQGFDDPAALARAFHDKTMETAEPWYRATLAFDSARLAEIGAQLDGREYVSDDPTFPIVQALIAGAAQDPDVLRGLLSIGGMIATPDELFSDAALFEKVLGFAGQEVAPPNAPTREKLLELVG